jgi:hypothetical protein
VPRRKKQTVWQQLWTEATPLRKIITAALTTIVLAGSAAVAWSNISKTYNDNWYVPHYGVAPHASAAKVQEIEKFVDTLAQFSQGEIVARQVQRQMQIQELTARCNANRCSPYERQALSNLMEQWQAEQRVLDSLRRQNAQQAAPYYGQQPMYPR